MPGERALILISGRSPPYRFGIPGDNHKKMNRRPSGYSTKKNVTPGGERKNICGIPFRPTATCIKMSSAHPWLLFVVRCLLVVSVYTRSNSNSTCYQVRGSPAGTQRRTRHRKTGRHAHASVYSGSLRCRSSNGDRR